MQCSVGGGHGHVYAICGTKVVDFAPRPSGISIRAAAPQLEILETTYLPFARIRGNFSISRFLRISRELSEASLEENYAALLTNWLCSVGPAWKQAVRQASLPSWDPYELTPSALLTVSF